MMNIRPAGHRILIEPEKVEGVSKGGIVIPKEVNKEEQKAQVIGLVLDIGPTAYADQDTPWCKVGDRVLYQRYSGMRIPDENGKLRDDRLLLNDLDVTAVVEAS